MQRLLQDRHNLQNASLRGRLCRFIVRALPANLMGVPFEKGVLHDYSCKAVT